MSQSDEYDHGLWHNLHDAAEVLQQTTVLLITGLGRLVNAVLACPIMYSMVGLLRLFRSAPFVGFKQRMQLPYQPFHRDKCIVFFVLFMHGGVFRNFSAVASLTLLVRRTAEAMHSRRFIERMLCP